MSSRKVCTSVFIISLSLGTLSDLQALPPQGARGENRILQNFSSRIFQDVMDFWRDFMEQNAPPAPEGPGLCPNGKPPGHQNTSGGGNGNGNGNGNG